MVTWLRVWRFFFPWRYDSRNPARRYCKDCGQQQDLYGIYDADPLDGGKFIPTGWENMFDIRECKRNH